MEMRGRAKRGTVELSHPPHRPLEHADAAGVSHISPSLDGELIFVK
jgi:hypothetical protein